MRARSQGLAGYLWDGRKDDPFGTRSAESKGAAKVDKKLPPKGSRTCPDCGTKLSRYTTGPLCQRCHQKAFLGGPE